MTTPAITRKAGRFFFDSGPERWSAVDLETPRVINATHHLRYGPAPDFDLAQALDDFRYLVLDCPTTKLAQQKLALIRRAYRTVAP
jgi:hypothetical protein